MVSFSMVYRPIVYVLHMKEEEEPQFIDFISQPQNQLLCSSRITLLAYISKPNSFFYTNYPINILRNIAIRHSTTSHYLLIDMDMMISKNSYETLRKLPPDIVEPANHVFVLPAFFSRQWELPDLPLQQQMEAYICYLDEEL